MKQNRHIVTAILTVIGAAVIALAIWQTAEQTHWLDFIFRPAKMAETVEEKTDETAKTAPAADTAAPEEAQARQTPAPTPDAEPTPTSTARNRRNRTTPPPAQGYTQATPTPAPSEEPAATDPGVV